MSRARSSLKRQSITKRPQSYQLAKPCGQCGLPIAILPVPVGAADHVSQGVAGRLGLRRLRDGDEFAGVVERAGDDSLEVVNRPAWLARTTAALASVSVSIVASNRALVSAQDR